jgi:hypothetical protein
MPYKLPLPNALKRWKVKILDNELLFEEPHATIVCKEELWRYGLRRRDFLDDEPNPDRVPKQLMAEITAKYETLRQAWDARFPTNPVSPAEEKVEGESEEK